MIYFSYPQQSLFSFSKYCLPVAIVKKGGGGREGRGGEGGSGGSCGGDGGGGGSDCGGSYSKLYVFKDPFLKIFLFSFAVTV